MITEKFVSQGEDVDFTGKLLDYAGDPIDLSAIAYQLYVVIHDAAGTVVKKFADDNGAPIATWEVIDIPTPSNGEFRVFLYSTETKPLKEGKYYVEVRLKVLDALYGPDDGSLDVVQPRIYLLSLLNSVINNLLP